MENTQRVWEAIPKLTPEFLKEIDVLYSSAMREICTKFENLRYEFEYYKARNPIRHITHRLKKPDSILSKMVRKELPLDHEVIREKITDIGGVRVICSYIDDIYDIAEMLKRQDDITVMREKDYIKNPKPNGYRSYHLTVGVPVFFSEETRIIPVEIQMRTLAMDFWASLEHPIRYKNAGEVSETTRERLTAIAQTIYDADIEMQQIYKEIRKIPKK